MTKLFLNRVEKSDAVIPQGKEIRILQNTEDTRYLILPASPQSLSQAELQLVAGGDDSTVTYTETVVAVYETEAVAVDTTVAVECEVVAALI